MGIQDIIAISVAAAAALWVVRMFTKSFSGESGCGCSAKPSATGESSCSAKPRTGLKQHPLVPLESVGLPNKNPPQEHDTD